MSAAPRLLHDDLPTDPFDKEQALRRLAGRFFPDAAYQDDPALRQFARAVWTMGFRAGHAAGRDEVR